MLLRTHTHADQEPVYIIRSPLAAQYSCKQHKTHLQRCVLVAFNKTACKWRYKKHIVIEQSLGRPLHTGSERSNKFSVAILFSPSAANLPHWTQYAAMAVSTLSNVIFGHGYRIFINTAKQLTTCIINCKKIISLTVCTWNCSFMPNISFLCKISQHDTNETIPVNRHIPRYCQDESSLVSVQYSAAQSPAQVWKAARGSQLSVLRVVLSSLRTFIYLPTSLPVYLGGRWSALHSSALLACGGSTHPTLPYYNVREQPERYGGLDARNGLSPVNCWPLGSALAVHR